MHGVAQEVRQEPAVLLSRRRLLLGSIALPPVLALYATGISRHEIDITQRIFMIRDLPTAFDGFRIVQFSDIHLEEYTEEFFLRRVLHEVNALKPDLLLITGDFVTRTGGPLGPSLEAASRCAAMLGSLTCPQRFGVLGNHDANVGSRLVRAHLADYGLPLLVNEHVQIERDNQHIYLCGLDDYDFGAPNLSLALPQQPDAPVLLMVHEPDYADTIVTHPRGHLVDLIFSGHTHGGQVRLPFLPPLSLPPNGRRYVEGHYLIGSTQLYVNRGIGTVGLPIRFNCPPEITVATLRRAETPLTQQRSTRAAVTLQL